MPHQCTACSRTFADGSKEMLSGCPDCGGNKFQFLPSGAAPPPDDEPPERTEPPTVAKTAAKATMSIREWVRSSRQSTLNELPSDDDRTATSATTQGATAETGSSQLAAKTSQGAEAAPGGDHASADATVEPPEDRAQADARSGIVPPEELPDPPAKERTIPPSRSEDRPMSLAELREELNDQFESIKIVDRGQYELNLMELFERDEYIISLRENGRYVIEVPEAVYGSMD